MKRQHRKLALVCSLGGHFEQMANLADVYSRYDHFWLTNPNAQTTSHLATERKYFVPPAHYKKPWTYCTQIPGVIKAFHWHHHQDDVWYVVDGMARVVLYDRRPGSPTHGVIQVVYAGEDNPVVILIPSGVAHGYQVLGRKPVILFYHVTQAYDPQAPDEQRIAFDDPAIGFDWSIQNR